MLVAASTGRRTAVRVAPQGHRLARGLGSVAVLAGAAALGVGLCGPAAAANDLPDWKKAQSVVDQTLALWRPTYSAGLPLQRPNGVQSEICPGIIRSAMAYATYSRGKKPENPGRPSFIISEQVARSHCADGGFSMTGPVATVATKYGRATISAFCGWDVANDQPVREWNGRCRKSDVLRHGGAVVAWHPRQSGGVDAADISITTDGLSYKQLVRIVRGLRPVPGS